MIDINTVQILIITLIYLHVANVTYEIYYHRGIIHEGLVFSPKISWAFQFLSWLLFDQIPNKYHLCSHKIHHAYSDTNIDPHGPYSLGVKTQFLIKPFKRTIFEIINTFNFKKKEIYPPTKFQKKFLGNLNNFNVYEFFEKNSQYGRFIFLLINFLIFGIDGIVVYFLFVITSNILRDVILDGLAHFLGYTNYSTKDCSKNIFPFAILFCGGELHNNHHANPNNVKIRKKWFEFDIGWVYISILNFFKLCKISKLKLN